MTPAKIPTPVNEPILAYAPGSRERGELKHAIKDLSSRQVEIPVVIGGKEIRTGKTIDAVMPLTRRSRRRARRGAIGPPGAWPIGRASF